MAVIVHEGDIATEGYAWGGGQSYNNAAELCAVLSALNLAAQRRAHHVTIVTDNDYVWTNVERWQQRWVAGTLHAIANPQLWAALFRVKYDLELAGTRVDIHWTRAHAGQPLNERADRLAVAARKRQGYIAENYNYGVPLLRIQQPA